MPVLTVKVLILRAVQSDYESGKPDVVVNLRFHDVDEFEIKGFKHLNSIAGLSIVSRD